MAKGKKTRTKEQSQLQKHRTAKNKINKYSRLIRLNPDSKDSKVWITKVDRAESALK